MSIEALIREQTEALKANTAAILLLEASLVGRAGGNSKPAKEEKPKAIEKAEKAAEAASTKEAQEAIDKEQDETQEQPTKEQPTKEELQEAVAGMKAEGVEYGTVRELVLKLAPTKREAIKKINEDFEIANLKALLDKEDDFSTVNDQSKLDAIYAELQKLEA